MDTNKLLRKHGWASHPDFPKIARQAAKYAKSLSEEEILAALEKDFCIKEKITLNQNAASISEFGILGEDYDNATYNQVCTAAKLPVAKKAALMPDSHLGYALPIGGVIALDNAVSPSFVGFDIACRMSCTILDITPNDFMDCRKVLANKLIESTSFGVGSKSIKEADHHIMHDSLWKEINILKELKEHARMQIGSSGGGNHFADLMIGKILEDLPCFGRDFTSFKKGDEFVALVTHSGSRGTGHKLATYYSKKAKDWAKFNTKGIPKGYEWLPVDSELGEEYWKVMELMGKYAQANHEIIHYEFTDRSGIRDLMNVQNHHNFAWKENGLVVHRKGATPAHKSVFGVIPGSMGTASYIVRGLGNEASLNSASHGAGRLTSRTQAKRDLDVKAHAEHVKAHDILTIGVGPDESYQAYKDIEHVMKMQSTLVKPVARMFPKVVLMGDRSDDGD